MPYSGDDFDGLLGHKLRDLSPGRVLDLGIGAGKIGQLVRACSPTSYLAGVEAEPSYQTRFEGAWAAYDHTYVARAEGWSLAHASERFDLVIMGDILEHLWAHEPRDLIAFWIQRSKWLLAIWPTGYVQDAYEGVQSEVHCSEPVLSDFADYDVRYYEKRERATAAGHKHFMIIRGRMC